MTHSKGHRSQLHSTAVRQPNRIESKHSPPVVVPSHPNLSSEQATSHTSSASTPETHDRISPPIRPPAYSPEHPRPRRRIKNRMESVSENKNEAKKRRKCRPAMPHAQLLCIVPLSRDRFLKKFSYSPSNPCINVVTSPGCRYFEEKGRSCHLSEDGRRSERQPHVCVMCCAVCMLYLAVRVYEKMIKNKPTEMTPTEDITT